MTGDTDIIDAAQGTDPTAGSGQPRNEGETQATQADVDAGGSSSGETGTATGTATATETEAGGPATPADPRQQIAYNLALAALIKPIETAATDLYAPEKQPARDAVVKTYSDAVARNGVLRVKMDKASASFMRAAADMDGSLDEWTPKLTDATKPLGAMLKRRAETLASLTALTGKNEKAKADAQQATTQWAARHADWSAPADAIGKIIDSYLTQIDKLNADINNEINKDAAILSFWFEIAPRHLQVSDQALTGDAQAALTKVIDALNAASFTDLADKLDPAKTRANGGVWLLPASSLTAKRESVFASWKTAAETQATAEAAFKLAPDDAGTLKTAWDTLKADAWIKDAKASLSPPA